MQEENFGIRQNVWNGLKSSFSRMSIALFGSAARIVTLDETDNDLGKTDLYQNIYLNPKHKLVAELPETEAVMMITGVYGHESMHQKMTDFSVFARETEKKPEDEQETFHMICNIIEDPAIEHFAYQFFGGKLLNAMRFCIMQTYRKAPPLEQSKTPAAQFFNALIQYGDGGILKGSFTFPEARRIFHEVIPFVDSAIETFDTQRRIMYMDKVFELSRPIWEPEKDFIAALHEVWQQLGRDHKNSSGFGDPSMREKIKKGGTESKIQRRRKITFRRVSKEEAESIIKNAGNAADDPNADIEVLITDEPLNMPEGGAAMPLPAAQGNGNGTEKKGDKEQDAETGSGVGKEGEADEASDAPSAGLEGSQTDMDAPEDGTSEKDGVPFSGVSMGGFSGFDNGETEITEEEYHLSDDMLKEIVKDIKKAIQEDEREKIAVQDNENLDFTPSSKEYKGVKCVNYKVTVDAGNAEAVYQNLTSPMEGMISSIVGQFKRIFRKDKGNKEYRNSGKVSIKRLTSGKMTTRVFERYRAPENKSDMAALMLIDESGSMSGEKSETARNTAIMLAEAFAKLHVPLKVIGFTEGFGSVEHFHYLSWKNNPQERQKLLNITARMGNFDGYAIRYGSDLLNKRKEEHKLMIVVSDGYPASRYYSSFEEGVNDTRNAVQHASKKAKVLGILIGNESPEQHQYMYGINLLHITEVEQLPSLLAQRIKRIVKGW